MQLLTQSQSALQRHTDRPISARAAVVHYLGHSNNGNPRATSTTTQTTNGICAERAKHALSNATNGIEIGARNDEHKTIYCHAATALSCSNSMCRAKRHMCRSIFGLSCKQGASACEMSDVGSLTSCVRHKGKAASAAAHQQKRTAQKAAHIGSTQARAGTHATKHAQAC